VRAEVEPNFKRPCPPLSRGQKLAIRTAVFERDGWACQLSGVLGAGRCYGHLTPHHKRKEGQGGCYSMENLVSLCAHHNDSIESDADLAALARTLGFLLLAEDVAR